LSAFITAGLAQIVRFLCFGLIVSEYEADRLRFYPFCSKVAGQNGRKGRIPEMTTKGTRDTSERRQKITTMLQEQGSVQVLALSAFFEVSTPTIRKDLDYLEKRGIASRCYGGALATQLLTTQPESPIETKRTLRASEKEAIGRTAAALVEPGDSVILDSGTTTAYIARNLPDREDITVITNDAGVLLELLNKEYLQVVMLGGALRRKNLAFYGSQGIAALDDLVVDKLFLGVDGFDSVSGITTHFENEALLNRQMVRMASQVIAVTDGSKFGKKCLHKIVGIADLDLLVADASASAETLEEVRRQGVEVLIAR
jgi:DeoR family transcriptional regulator of aga operon